MTGAQRFRRAFLETPLIEAGDATTVIRAGERSPALLLIRTGFAYSQAWAEEPNSSPHHPFGGGAVVSRP